MERHDWDKLLEQGLSGDPPGQAFRAKVLLESSAALAHRRRILGPWRLATLSAAAVVIAAVSFLLGRYSAGPGSSSPSREPAVAAAGDSVAVSNEVVAWLQAARLFKQLGMEDRMALAVDRAGKLLPRDAVVSATLPESSLLAGCESPGDSGESPDSHDASWAHQSSDIVKRIMASSSGGYSHADKMD